MLYKVITNKTRKANCTLKPIPKTTINGSFGDDSFVTENYRLYKHL